MRKLLLLAPLPFVAAGAWLLLHRAPPPPEDPCAQIKKLAALGYLSGADCTP